MSKQVNLFPDRAATFVVHPTPGIGDATTIQEALDMLPAGGGSILVREGTYSIAATITLPVAKPVTIRGCGNSTIIDLGANAIPAFTIPTGATTNTPIVLDNFLVTGTEVALQTLVQYNDANGLAEIYMENIVTTGVEVTINVTNSASASSTPGQDDARFHMLRCRIRPNSTNNSIILSNPSFGLPRAWLTEVEFIGDSLFAIPALRTAPLFGRLADDLWFGDCYLESCEMSIGTGRSDFAAFECFNSTLWNNDNVNTLVHYVLHGSFEGLNTGTVRDSACKGIYFEVFESGSNFFSNSLVNCPIELYGAGIVVGDNNIQQSGTWPVSQPYVIRVHNENTVIRNNLINAKSTFCIDLEAPCTITGNDFSSLAPPANGTLYINANECVIVSNRFRSFPPTTGPSVNEVNGTNFYSDNINLFTNKTGGGPIIDPILPHGNGSCIQGMLGQAGTSSVGGTATNNIIVWYRNPYGLAMTKGYIKNAGANNITVRESWITDTLGTFTRTAPVLTPGSQLTLDPYDFTGVVGLVGNFQVVDYRVDVSGTATSWYVFFPMPCGVAAM